MASEPTRAGIRTITSCTAVVAMMSLAICACARARSGPAPLPDEVRGLFEIGYESYDFRPCTPTDALTRRLRPDSGVSLSLPGKGGRGGYNSYVYFVRLRGAVDSLAVPNPGGGVRDFLVHEVLEIRPPQRGECGWRPGRGI